MENGIWDPEAAEEYSEAYDPKEDNFPLFKKMITNPGVQRVVKRKGSVLLPKKQREETRVIFSDGLESMTDGKTVWVSLFESSLKEANEDMWKLELIAHAFHEFCHIRFTDFADMERIQKFAEKLFTGTDIRPQTARAIGANLLNGMVEDPGCEAAGIAEFPGMYIYLWYKNKLIYDGVEFSAQASENEILYQDFMNTLLCYGKFGELPRGYSVYAGSELDSYVKKAMPLIDKSIDGRTSNAREVLCEELLTEISPFVIKLLENQEKLMNQIEEFLKNFEYKGCKSQQQSQGSGSGSPNLRKGNSPAPSEKNDSDDKEDSQNSESQDGKEGPSSSENKGEKSGESGEEDNTGSGGKESSEDSEKQNGKSKGKSPSENSDKENGESEESDSNSQSGDSEESQSEGENSGSSGESEESSESTNVTAFSKEELEQAGKEASAEAELEAEKGEAQSKSSKEQEEGAEANNAKEELKKFSRTMYGKTYCSFEEQILSKMIRPVPLPPELVSDAKRIKKALKKIFREDKMPETGLRSGKLSKSGVIRLATTDKVFQKERNRGLQDAAIYLLIDNSGSMNSEGSPGKIKYEEARSAAAVIEEALVGFIPVRIALFDTERSVRHRVIRDFDDKSHTNYSYSSLRCIPSGGGNADSVNILTAALELAKRKEHRKFLFILSDGTPSAYGSRESAEKEVARVVKEAKKMGVTVVPIMFGDEMFRQYYMPNYERMYEKNILSCSAENIISKLPPLLARVILK